MTTGLSVSFVMPMFNEEDNIRRAIATVTSLAKELGVDHEIIVVDDASTDNSAEIALSVSRDDPAVKVFRLEKNTKFGGAFARGFKEATKDVILYMDSDMPVSDEDIKSSLPIIENADIVTGYSRVKKGDTFFRKIMSGVYNLMVQTMFGLNIKDINSGYKVVRRRVVEGEEFLSRSPFVDVELFLFAKRKGCTVRQFPLVFKTRPGGKSHIARIPVIIATFADMFRVKIASMRGPKAER